MERNVKSIVSNMLLRARILYWTLHPRVTLLQFGQGKKDKPFTIQPMKKRKFVFLNAPAGEIAVEFKHTDQIVHWHSKSLWATVKAPGVTSKQLSDQSPKLALSERFGAFSYVSGGRNRRQKVSRGFTFNLKAPKGFFVLELISKLDRVINIDSMVVIERSVQLAQLEVKSRFNVNPVILDQAKGDAYVSRLLALKPELTECTSIVYADIDLNVVDGSSVWVSSFLSLVGQKSKCIFISRKDITTGIITDNVKAADMVEYISPSDLGLNIKQFNVEDAVSLIESLDRYLPNIQRVYLRGLSAALALVRTRQFFDRCCFYLTDFYTLQDGERIVSDDSAKAVRIAGRQAGKIIVQTEAIEKTLSEIIGVKKDTILIPPVITIEEHITPKTCSTPFAQRPLLKLGYAGKIVPNWGVEQLFEWAEKLETEGYRIEITIVANKVSGGSLKGEDRVEFIQEMRKLIKEKAFVHFENMNREQAMSKMAEMDIVWCYRPAVLEENTLELSSKLVEMVGLGAVCVCYPNSQNVEVLGEEYPFYVKDYDSFKGIIGETVTTVPSGTVENVVNRHSMEKLGEVFSEQILSENSVDDEKPTIGMAVHDPKFLLPYISTLKNDGYSVQVDMWEWGKSLDIKRAQNLLADSDIIFCEWGLANAVWYSQNNVEQKPLFVRMHLQEVKERARKFGNALNIENVTKIIFVSENVRDKAIELFGWPKEKTIVIPNFVLPDEYQPVEKPRGLNTVNFGMVGIIPQRKRLDRAIDLLEMAIKDGIDAHLYIKGPRPETLDYMHAPGRVEELTFYNEQYARFEGVGELKERIHFEPWGNDVAIWYEKIDFILSPSDFESFHYALADGILSGCVPLIWPWEEADRLYKEDWISTDTDAVFSRVIQELKTSEQDRVKGIQQRRQFIIERYGQDAVFTALSECIFQSVPVMSSEILEHNQQMTGAEL